MRIANHVQRLADEGSWRSGDEAVVGQEDYERTGTRAKFKPKTRSAQTQFHDQAIKSRSDGARTTFWNTPSLSEIPTYLPGRLGTEDATFGKRPWSNHGKACLLTHLHERIGGVSLSHI